MGNVLTMDDYRNDYQPKAPFLKRTKDKLLSLLWYKNKRKEIDKDYHVIDSNDLVEDNVNSKIVEMNWWEVNWQINADVMATVNRWKVNGWIISWWLVQTQNCTVNDEIMADETKIWNWTQTMDINTKKLSLRWKASVRDVIADQSIDIDWWQTWNLESKVIDIRSARTWTLKWKKINIWKWAKVQNIQDADIVEVLEWWEIYWNVCAKEIIVHKWWKIWWTARTKISSISRNFSKTNNDFPKRWQTTDQWKVYNMWEIWRIESDWLVFDTGKIKWWVQAWDLYSQNWISVATVKNSWQLWWKSFVVQSDKWNLKIDWQVEHLDLWNEAQAEVGKKAVVHNLRWWKKVSIRWIVKNFFFPDSKAA